MIIGMEDLSRKIEDGRRETEERRNKRRLIPPWRRGLGGWLCKWL